MEHIFAMGTDQARPRFEAMCQMFFKRFETPTPPAQVPGKEEEGREDNEEEQEQKESQPTDGSTSAKRVQ